MPFIKKTGKKLEWYWRGIRSYLSWKDFQTYKKYTQKKPIPAEDKPLVYFDFTNPKIDEDAGRYAYLLIKDFIESDYQAAIAKRYNFFATFNRKSSKKLLSQENYVTYSKNKPSEQAKLIISDSPHSLKLWKKKAPDVTQILVLYSPKQKNTQQELHLPYYPHPVIVSKRLLRKAPDANNRPICISFAGNNEKQAYHKTVISQAFKIFTRWELVNLANKHFQKNTTPLTNKSFQTEISPSDYARPESDTMLKLENYIQLLQSSRFYLACPGSNFAISHNLPEAMLSGCVPILQYAHHLEPPLEGGINCLTFHDEASLIQSLNVAKAMDNQTWATIQSQSLQYATKYFQPGSFSKGLIGPLNDLSPILNIYSFSKPKRNKS